MKLNFMAKVLMSTLFILAFSFTIVYADDCSIGRTPDGVYPIEDKDVVMVSEDIWVDVEKGLVECKFIFKNTGEEKDVLMGFPAKLEDDGDNTMDENLYFDDFKTYLKDTAISVQTEKGIKPIDLKDSTYPYYSEWFTFNVHFDPGETKNIRNTYKVNSTTYSMGDVLSGYILKTGSFWKDKIGYAKVTFDLGSIKPYEISRIFPFTMRYEGNNKLVWENSNFEPEFDMEIMYNTRRYDIEEMKTMEYIEKEHLETVIEEVYGFEELFREMDGMSKDELKNQYNKYFEEQRHGIAKYIQSKMPKDMMIEEKGPVIKELVVNEDHISCIAEDENGDYASARLKISHIENGQEVVDSNELLEVKYFSGEPQADMGAFFSLSKDKKYEIEFTIKDSYDNMDVKKIKYPHEEEEEKNTKPELVDENVENHKNDNKNKNEDTSPKKVNSEQNQNLPIIVLLGSVVLGVVVLGGYILFIIRR